jgi:UDP-N-acetylglucosamine 2-epimerase (non-hydrolysing)
MAKNFKLVTFLGIRPDIIRMHKLLALLDEGQARHGYQHIYVHSGQHYDFELDGVFHRQLNVKPPKLNLRVGRILKKTGKTGHVHQSALLFQKTAEMIERLRPDAVLYLGDTNTVLSSIIVAKYNIPVIHIEGGGRSFDWRMPEEKNRIVIDHLSDLIYCYLDRYKQLLVSEGIPEFRIVTVGNIIVDALSGFLSAADKNPILDRLGLRKGEYALCTLHREENLDNSDVLVAKLRGLQKLSKTLPVVLPVMPRLRARIRENGLNGMLKNSKIITTEPLGFIEFLKLEKAARLIVTDSGTVQEEALILGVPCLVTRRSTERPETMGAGATTLDDQDVCGSAHKTLQMGTNWDRTVLNPQGGSPSVRIYQDLIGRIRGDFFAKSRRLDAIRQNPFVRQAYGIESSELRAVAAS